MINAYLILSRVKRAHGLVLLRAFSPELFRTGVAPGPHCLLKFLRCAHSSQNSDAKYSTQDAQEEYQYRTRKVAGRIKLIDEHGLPLLCHGCNNRLCPEFHGQGSRPLDQIYSDEHLKACWEQGCRRRCSECEKLLTLPSKLPRAECEQCAQRFPQEKDEKLCGGCTNWRTQQEHWCERCNKNFSWNEVHFLPNDFTGDAEQPRYGIGRVICKQCAPELTQLRCYVCGEDKIALKFPKAERKIKSR